MYNKALKIIKNLQKAGYVAYFAGGTARDILMDKKPKDYDIATSAKPDEVQKLIKKTYEVGKQFGVIVAPSDGENIHIATFRREGKYSDARRPDKVYFASYQDDAKRRDFTVNGIFYDPIKEEVIDCVGAIEDLKNKIIRFIGNADDRIAEDNLRILRALRFKNNLSFKYNSKDLKALKKNVSKIKTVSAERIRDELNKMLEDSHRAQAIKDMSDIGILKIILPELAALKKVEEPQEYHMEGNTFNHTLSVLSLLPKQCPIILVWSALLHDIGKKGRIKSLESEKDKKKYMNHTERSVRISGKILNRLKFPKDSIEKILWIVKNHHIFQDYANMKESTKQHYMDNPNYPVLIKLSIADTLGSKPKDPKLTEKRLREKQKIKAEFEYYKKRPKFKMIISGKDLIAEFGLKPGPKIGQILKHLEEAQREGKIKTKQQALSVVKKKFL